MDAQPEQVVKAQGDRQESSESGELCWTAGSDARQMNKITALIFSRMDCYHFVVTP